eukprot:9162219-Alexandrium_andersonii.AAC.1
MSASLVGSEMCIRDRLKGLRSCLIKKTAPLFCSCLGLPPCNYRVEKLLDQSKRSLVLLVFGATALQQGRGG